MTRPMMALEFPDVPGLAEEFRRLPKSLAAASIGAAVKRAMAPAVAALKNTTPVGPTGNLRRGIFAKTKRYPQTGISVALVGFKKPGSNKPPKAGTKRRNKSSDSTYHQFLVEFGSKPRYTKSRAYRGVSPARRPIQRAWEATMPQVQADLQKEMAEAAKRALQQLPKYLAARAKKGRL